MCDLMGNLMGDLPCDLMGNLMGDLTCDPGPS